MGSAKQAALEQADRNYARNRYQHQRAKLKERIRLYADNPGFVAVLRHELETLERAHKLVSKKK